MTMPPTLTAEEARAIADAIDRHSAAYAELVDQAPGEWTRWKMVYPDWTPEGDTLTFAWDGALMSVERADVEQERTFQLPPPDAEVQ